MEIAEGGPVIAVASKFTEIFPAAAFSVLVPGVGPRTQPPTVARPCALVVTEPPETVPPPAAAVNVTVTPGIGPAALVTTTEGGVGTGVPYFTAWLLPPLMAMEVGWVPLGPPLSPPHAAASSADVRAMSLSA